MRLFTVISKRVSSAGKAASLESDEGAEFSPGSKLQEKFIKLHCWRGVSDTFCLEAAPMLEFAIRRRLVEFNQQGFSLRLTENERMPSVTIAPYVSGEKASDREREFGLNLSFPLPLWNRNEGNIEAAKARLAQASASLSVTRRELERDVATRTAAYNKLLEEMAHWQPDTVTRFREAAELADRHYRLGAVPVATYMEMQRSYLDALDAMFSAQADAFENRQQLELLTGKSFAK